MALTRWEVAENLNVGERRCARARQRGRAQSRVRLDATARKNKNSRLGFRARTPITPQGDARRSLRMHRGKFPRGCEHASNVTLGARDYDPATGRWTGKDPIRFESGQNFYVYTWSDPVNLIDRYGREPSGAGGASGSGEGGSRGTSGTGDPRSWIAPSPDWCGSGWNEPLVPDGAFGVDWSDACRQHDACYGACGADKGACDERLNRDISQKCSWCGPVGSTYETAVDWFGNGAYNSAQEQACSCR